MKPTEMKARCGLCKHYRLITYGDGGCAIGCMKASHDGIYPVDISKLERCPREHSKKRFNKVESADLLPLLGKIFAMTSASPAVLALHEMLKNAGPSVKRKSQYVGKALVEMGILKVVSRGVKGEKGMRCSYRWNMKIGAPSLEMVDKINCWLKDCNERVTARKYQVEAQKVPKGSESLVVDKGATLCEQCWMRDTPDCMARVKTMGLDCKKVNINTLRHAEASMG